jgi:hypothetical protein
MIFGWLIIGHLIGDWLIQTSYQANNKMRGPFINKALFVHSLTYTIVFIPILLVFKISLGWLLVLFVSHYLLDRRRLVRWWMSKVKKVEKGAIGDHAPLTIMVDQVFHLLILALIAVLTG